jgi:hypothetical protein
VSTPNYDAFKDVGNVEVKGVRYAFGPERLLVGTLYSIPIGKRLW